MSSLVLTVGLIGYVVTAAVYAAVGLLAVAAGPTTMQARWLVAALVASAAWALSLAAAIWLSAGLPWWLPGLDGLHALVWILFLGAILEQSADRHTGRLLGRGLMAASVGLAVAVLVTGSPVLGPARIGTSQYQLLGVLGLAVVGLLTLEQVFRNSSEDHRKSLVPIALAIGLIFAVDLFVYSQAVLFGAISAELWLLRSLGNIVAAPAILLAVKRQPDWAQQLFVSRHVVFYTATLVASGFYLLAMAGGGLLIARIGGNWGVALQWLFFVAAIAVLAALLFSLNVRRRVQVFIAKHFYRNRYDYRVEWLRLIETLASSSGRGNLPERSVQALAAIIRSDRGELWFARDPGDDFAPYGAWNSSLPKEPIARRSRLAEFLQRSHWIVDTDECVRDPEKYGNEFSGRSEELPVQSIIVPLVHSGVTLGIARLERPTFLTNLTYEDHDLLRTAGQQVATFLMQEVVQEELAQTKQFEAYNRLAAFLMHDLKNLIAQQELVVANAQRFKSRPDFIDDAIATIRAGVKRMRLVLDKLEGGDPQGAPATHVDPAKLLQEVCESCADRRPAPELEIEAAIPSIRVDPDRLAMAVTHAVRNAQDATPADGRVRVRLARLDTDLSIEIVDTGAGMDQTFIRERLFRPFDSTKGSRGMGIGAYQIRETVRAAGGEVSVTSTVGVGTTFELRIPCAAAPPDRHRDEQAGTAPAAGQLG